VLGGRVDDPLLVVRAVKAGRAFVTSGPFLEARIGDAMPGDTVTVAGGSIDVAVTVRAAPWMEVSRLDFYVGPAVVHTETIAPPASGGPPVVRFEGTVTLPVPRDAYVIVLARGERGLEQLLGKTGVPPLAFTNPIWLVRPRPRARPRPGVPDAGEGVPGEGTGTGVELEEDTDETVDEQPSQLPPPEGR
jgi:hypothetical protein